MGFCTNTDLSSGVLPLHLLAIQAPTRCCNSLEISPKNFRLSKHLNFHVTFLATTQSYLCWTSSSGVITGSQLSSNLLKLKMVQNALAKLGLQRSSSHFRSQNKIDLRKLGPLFSSNLRKVKMVQNGLNKLGPQLSSNLFGAKMHKMF